MSLQERLLVVIDGKAGGAISEFRKVSSEADAANKKTQTGIDGIGKSSAKTGALIRSGLVAGGAAAGAAFVKFGLDSAKATSDLGESVSKANVVFGSAAGSVLKFGENAAKSIGQSNRQAVEAAGTFGNLFVSMGIGEQKAADLSIGLVKLASDLASFNNSSPEEALEALRSGLTGETEPLKRFGVNLSAAAVQAEALRLGLQRGKGELSASAKAQATYSLILQQTTTAQGDFERTSGGLANQQRILAAEFEDTQASLGKIFIPLLLQGAQAANAVLGPLGSLAEQVEALPGPVKQAAVGMLALVAATKLTQRYLVPLGGGVVKRLSVDFTDLSLSGQHYAKSASSVAATEGKVGRAIKAAGAAIGPVNLALGAGALAVGLYADAKRRAADRVNAFVEAIGRDGGALAANTRQAAVAALEQQRALKAAETLGISTRDVTDAALGNADAQARVSAVLGPLVENLKRANVAGLDASFSEESHARAAQILDKALNSTDSTVRQAAEAYKRQQTAAGGSATATREQGQAAETAAAKNKTLADVLDRASGRYVDQASAQIALKESIAGLSQSYKDNGASLDINTAKGRENRKAVLDAVDAANRKASADEKAGVSQGKSAAAYRTSIDAIRKAAKETGLNRAEVDRLIASVVKLPPKRDTKVTAPGAESAKQKMDAATRAANGIPTRASTTVTASDRATSVIASVTRQLATLNGKRATTYVESIRIGSGPAALGARAGGGAAQAGVPYLVGERRPEVFIPSTNGTVRPTSNGAAGGGDTIINIYGAPGQDPRQLAREVGYVIGADAALLAKVPA